MNFRIPIDINDIKQLIYCMNQLEGVRCNNYEIILSHFEIIHNSFVSSIENISSYGQGITSEALKIYYKYRHNIFAMLYSLLILGIELPFGTDMKFPEFVNSNRTPDLIINDVNKVIVYEFCVGLKIDRLDYLKGGNTFYHKYQDEINEYNALGYKASQFNVLFTLKDEPNWNELRIIKPEDKKVFQKFRSLCLNGIEWIATTIGAEANTIRNDYLIDGAKRLLSKINKGRILNENPVYWDFKKMPDYVVSRLWDFEANLHWRSQKYKLAWDDNAKKRGAFQLRFNDKGKELSWWVEAKTRKLFSEICNYIDWDSIPSTNGSIKDVEIAIPTERRIVNTDFKLPWSNDFECQDFDCNIDDTIITGSYISVGNIVNVHLSSSLSHLSTINKHSKKFLSGNVINKGYINECIDSYWNECKNHPEIVNEDPKQTFSYPILDQFDKAMNYYPDQDVCQSLINCNPGKYTERILRKIINKQYSCDKLDSEEIIKLKDLFQSINNEIINDWNSTGKSAKLSDFIKTHKLCDEYKRALKNFRNAKLSQSNYGLEMYIRLSFNRTIEKEFNDEMESFTTKEKFRGTKRYDEIDTIKQCFDSFFEYLMHLDDHVTKLDINVSNFDHPTLTDLKLKHKEHYDEFESIFSRTKLSHVLYFIHHFCRFLFRQSTKSYNKDYVSFDNIGFKGVICLVRGGKKIQGSGMTKLFRLAYPISYETLKVSGWETNKRFKIFNMGGSIYVLTPWSQLRDSVITDGISLMYRVRSYLFSMWSRSKRFDKKNIIYPVILALSNKRKTEGFMHNTRYLLVNVLGDYANLKDIIVEKFTGISHTLLDLYIRQRIYINYAKFAQSLIEFKESKDRLNTFFLKNKMLPFIFDDDIENQDELTATIYCTYLMTKAPYDKSVEQGNNLLEILSDVKLFNDNHNVDDDFKDLEYNVLEREPLDDFQYDPQVAQLIGSRIASRLSRRCNKEKITQMFDKYINMNLIDLANANGLRGFNKENFFGKKGYQIVAEYIQSKIELGDDILEHGVSLNNMTLRDHIENTAYDKPVKFHVVDKVQRGLGREIFVMDLYTKMLQNPIEKIFAYMCNLYDNEYISISSNHRPHFIHSMYNSHMKIKDKHVYNFVLDCKRWAPHSVLQKYVDMIIPMCWFLPEGFKTIFFGYMDMMIHNKVFITRDYAVKVIENNKKFTEYQINMIKGEYAEDDWSFVVKFSFVMGIHNYLSSLMHAENQLLASEVIALNSALSNNYSKLNMIAHSDDSAGFLISDKSNISSEVFLYEKVLRSCNHMLSIKKSQVNSGCYFEFLSILYVNQTMLPVLTKFTSAMTFQPTDKGYGPDVSFAISQCIESLQNGATMEEAYIQMKMAQSLVQGYYGYTDPIDGIPYGLGGLLDCHPSSALISGGLSEYVRCIKYNTNKMGMVLTFLTNAKLINVEGLELTLSWDIVTRRNLLLDKKFPKMHGEFADSWFASQVKGKKDDAALLWFINKLDEPSFHDSITSQSPHVKIVRIMGARNYRCLKSEDGKFYSFISIVDILRMIDMDIDINKISAYTKSLDYYTDLMQTYYESLPESYVIQGKSEATNKPVRVTLVTNEQWHLKDAPLAVYVAFKKEKDLAVEYMKNKSVDYDRSFKLIDEHLNIMGVDPDSLTASTLYNLLQKMTKALKVDKSLIQCVRGDAKRVTDYITLMQYFSTAIFHDKDIVFSFKNASVADRKNVRNRLNISNDIIRYNEAMKVLALANKFNIVEHPFLYPLKQYLKDRKNVDPSWISFTQDFDGIQFSNVPYCHSWTINQKEANGKYYGKGMIYFRTPDYDFMLEVNDDSVTRVFVRNDFYPINNSPQTSWYLSEYIVKYFNLYSFADLTSDEMSIHIGYDNLNNLCIDYKKNLSYPICKVTKVDTFPIDQYNTETLIKQGPRYLVTNSKLKVYITGRPLAGNFCDISGFYDKGMLSDAIKNDNVSMFLRACTGVIDTHFIPIEDMTESLTSTLIYQVMYNMLDQDAQLDTPACILLSDAREANIINGFPTKQELMLIDTSGSSLINPSIKDLIKGKTKIPAAMVDQLKTLMLIKDPEDRIKLVLALKNMLSSDQLYSMLILSKKKMNNMYDVILCCRDQSFMEKLCNDFRLLFSRMEKMPLVILCLQQKFKKYRSVAHLLVNLFDITVYDCVKTRGDRHRLNSWHLLMSTLGSCVSKIGIDVIFNNIYDTEVLCMLPETGDIDKFMNFFMLFIYEYSEMHNIIDNDRYKLFMSNIKVNPPLYAKGITQICFQKSYCDRLFLKLGAKSMAKPVMGDLKTGLKLWGDALDEAYDEGGDYIYCDFDKNEEIQPDNEYLSYTIGSTDNIDHWYDYRGFSVDQLFGNRNMFLNNDMRRLNIGTLGFKGDVDDVMRLMIETFKIYDTRDKKKSTDNRSLRIPKFNGVHRHEMRSSAYSYTIKLQQDNEILKFNELIDLMIEPYVDVSPKKTFEDIMADNAYLEDITNKAISSFVGEEIKIDKINLDELLSGNKITINELIIDPRLNAELRAYCPNFFKIWDSDMKLNITQINTIKYYLKGKIPKDQVERGHVAWMEMILKKFSIRSGKDIPADVFQDMISMAMNYNPIEVNLSTKAPMPKTTIKHKFILEDFFK